jgi:hypothetical protein
MNKKLIVISIIATLTLPTCGKHIIKPLVEPQSYPVVLQSSAPQIDDIWEMGYTTYVGFAFVLCMVAVKSYMLWKPKKKYKFRQPPDNSSQRWEEIEEIITPPPMVPPQEP